MISHKKNSKYYITFSSQLWQNFCPSLSRQLGSTTFSWDSMI